MTMLVGSSVLPSAVDGELEPPDDFGWCPPILPIYRNRRWRGHVAARSLVPANVGAIYYVDPVLGSDAASGTATTPKRTVFNALQTTNVGMIYLAPGLNQSLNDGAWSNPVSIVTDAAHVIIKPWDIRMGRPLVTNAWFHQESNWAVYSDYPRVYQVTGSGRPGVTHVVDLAGGLNGVPAHYAKAASRAECNARPGTWAQNPGGSALFVNTINGAVPSPSLKVFIGNYCAYWPSHRPIYIEGIDFLGGVHTFWIPDLTCDVIMTDCGIYCGSANGLFANTSGLVITENCRSDYHGSDAFNYHESATHGPGKVVEIGNRSTMTGTNGTSNQCSTAHDQVKVARIGCDYSGAGSHVMADITDGTKAWNVGLQLGSSRDGKTGYLTVDAHSWNYDCDFGTSLTPLVVSGGKAFLDQSEPTNSATSGDGEICEYEQD